MRRNDGDWFPLSSDYPMHKRTLALIRTLGPRADCYPIRLMCWLRDQESVDGVFQHESDIETVARWEGNPGELVSALRLTGILDGLKYHGWESKGGQSVSRMIARRKHDVNSVQTVVATPSPSPSLSASPSAVKDGGLEEGTPASEVGMSPNVDAVHIAKRWYGLAPKGTCALTKASHQFARGLMVGIDKHALMRAAQENPGRLPHEIVDALKPKMAQKGKIEPRNSYEEAVRKASGG